MTRRSWCTRGNACPPTRAPRTAGIDKATVAQIETWIGVEAFLGQIRDSLKSGEFRPVEVRQVMIPKANRETPEARDSHRRRPGGPGQPEAGARAHLRGGFQAVLVRVPPEPARAGRDRRDPPLRLQAQQLPVGAGGRHQSLFR